MTKVGLIIFSILSFILFLYISNSYDYSSATMAKFSLIVLLGNVGILGWRFGLMSIPFVTGFIMYSVMMVPGIASFITGQPLYSFHNATHQLNPEITHYVLLISVLSVVLFTIINIAFARKEQPKLAETFLVRLRIPFIFTCILFLLCCYGAESGPTLLTGTYDDVRFNRSAVATLAGVALMAFWAMMYLQYRSFKYDQNQLFKRRLFFIVTIIGLTWLFLHSRRSELLGFFIVLALDDKLFKQKLDVKWIVIGISSVVLLQFNGALRNSGKLLSGFKETDSLVDQFAGASSYRDNTYYQAPSGIGNIMGTLQTSVYYIRKDNRPFLNGATIWSYPYKLIPTNILHLIGLPSPRYFHNYVYDDTGYSYNGGTFILAPSYANFGIAGFILATIVLALISVFMQRSFYKGNYFGQITSVIILLYYIKMVWYGPVPMLKALYMAALAHLIFASIFAVKVQKTKIQLTQ